MASRNDVSADTLRAALSRKRLLTTLLALVMAFAGVQETRRVYSVAIEERYRFYSFGDAMLVL